MPPVLKHVTRLDAMPLNQTFFTEEGYLRDRPVLTSTGIFEYRNPDGTTRRELRLPEEVFAPESLKSYAAKPIIITHDAGLVTKDNVSKYQIGTILSDGIRRGHDVLADIVIHDTDEMKECGLKELSLGYNLDLDEEPGIWNGMPYDAVQRNIRINHLALVREARAGDQARLNIDSRDSNTLIGGKVMRRKIRKNARRADGILSAEELQKAIAEYQAKYGKKTAGQDEDDVAAEEKEATKAPVEEPAADVDIEKDADDEEASVPQEVEAVKANREERANAGEPQVTEEAKALIKDQDDDIGILIDIIDTLLAERDFNAAKKDEDDTEAVPAKPEEEVAADEDDEEIPEEEKTDADDEETEELTEDADEEEETLQEDEDEEEEPLQEDEDEEEEPLQEDEDEEEELKEDEDDEPTFQKTPKEEKLNTDSAERIDKIVRTRIQLGMIGKKLNLDGLEKKSIKDAKKAIIKAVRPTIRLDGKSDTYINALYACVVDDVKNRKDISYQKRQMFNKDSKTVFKREDSAEAARDRMIRRRQNHNKK